MTDTDMTDEAVRVARSGPVTTVFLHRPARRNAVDRPTATQLAAAFRAFDADEFTRKKPAERKGVLALLLLMLALAGANLFMRLQPDEEPVYDPEFLALMDQFPANSAEDETGNRESRLPRKKYAKRAGRFLATKTFSVPSKPFDPNGLSAKDWMKLGLSEAQAASVKRFEEKGGHFYRKEDLKKLYVISEDFYRRVEPFLVFPEKAKPPPGHGETAISASTAEKVDINRADSVQLAALPGITPKMASRMLLVREHFGGFYGLEQVKDFYGFYGPSYEKLVLRAYAGDANLRPLNLNYCTFKELARVPGINYEAVKAIMNYRERNGAFKKTEDLVSLNLAEPGLYAKIAPYLTVK